MSDLLFAGFEYRGLNNLGDNIQSIAIERLLPAVKIRFNRDTLAQVDPDFPIKIIMNGWFSHFPETCLPLSKRLHPVFWGFHITDWNNGWKYFFKKQTIEYLKKFQPIGCRDPYTALRLADLGLETFVTYCLTLTLPKRVQLPLNGKIFAVDISPCFLPEVLRGQALFYSHILPGSRYREAQKRIYARGLLDMYQRQAKLVITTRLHCLLPCIAMGIPVIFFGNQNDYRISWVRELGVKIYTVDDLDTVDWDPQPLPFEIQKDKMISDFKKMISLI